MTRVITTENPTRDACRYLRHYAHEDFMRDRLAAVYPALSADRRKRKARDAALSIRQGLEYLDSAAASTLLTRPLPLFYAAENLVKALVIFMDAPADSSAFRTHGLSGDKAKRYSIKNLSCKVASPTAGVWAQALRVVNGDRIRVDVNLDGRSVTQDMWHEHPAITLRRGTPIQLGPLLRSLPELTDDVVFADWGHSFMVHVRLYRVVQTTAPEETQLTVQLRHAYNQPTKDMILRAERHRELLGRWTQTLDTLDVLEYQATFPRLGWWGPSLRLDTFGEWYWEFRTTRVLGELILYFASLFILSDVVRYQVEQWKRLLDARPSEALLVDRFLDVAGRKLPNLVLNELGQELHEFRFAR
jgi:hypothetical protein